MKHLSKVDGAKIGIPKIQRKALIKKHDIYISPLYSIKHFMLDFDGCGVEVGEPNQVFLYY